MGSLASSRAAGTASATPPQVMSNLPLMPPETVLCQGVPNVAMIVTMAPVLTTK